MLNKRKNINFAISKSNNLSHILHYILDIKMTNLIRKQYYKYATQIELKMARECFLKQYKNLSLTIDKFLYTNYLARKANDNAKDIMGYEIDNMEMIFKNAFSEALSVKINIMEQKIYQAIEEILVKELSNVKYVIREQVDAVSQYFKEQSNNLGTNPQKSCELIDKIITAKIATLKNKEKFPVQEKPGEAGKLVMNYLRHNGPVGKVDKSNSIY